MCDVCGHHFSCQAGARFHRGELSLCFFKRGNRGFELTVGFRKLLSTVEKLV